MYNRNIVMKIKLYRFQVKFYKIINNKLPRLSNILKKILKEIFLMYVMNFKNIQSEIER